MKRLWITLLLTTHMLLITIPCHAGERNGAFSLSPFLGGYSFDGTQHLRTEPVYGLRLGYDVTKNWAIEGVFAYVATSTTQQQQDVNVSSYRLDILYNLLPERALTPYLAMGGGWATKDPDHGTQYTDMTFNFGGGLKYFFTYSLALRGDVRQLLVFADKTVNNWEYSVGLSYLFGGGKPAHSMIKSEAGPAAVTAPETTRYCTAPLNILFDNDKTVIKNEYLDEVSQIGIFMQNSLSTTAVIEGHADDMQFSPRQTENVKNYLTNMELSQRRAESVINHLVKIFGIERSRLTAKWYGDTQREINDGTAEGRAKNRCVNVILDCAVKN